MNIYLIVVLICLVLKLWVSHYALNRERAKHKSELNNIILLSAITIGSFSIPQFFLLADGTLATPFGLPRYLLLRWYIVHSVLFATVGVYFFLSVFYPDILAPQKVNFSAKLLGVTIALVSAAFILFTNALIDDSQIGKRTLIEELGKSEDDTFLIFTRSLVAVFFISLFASFLRRYRNSSDHESQIINLYALIALFFSIVECVAALFIVHPLTFSIKGVLFTVVVFLACSDRRVFDARSSALVTLEAKSSRDMLRVFRHYTHSDLKHKDAMRQLEKVMVSYKLRKVSDFREPEGSPLPDVADNMGIKLSTLYELIKRLDIKRPKA